MESLRTQIILISMLFGSLALSAQTSEQTLKAFEDSYAHESSGDYKNALLDLQNIYQNDCYECNLRIAWLNYKAKNYATSMDYYQKASDLKKFSVEARMGFISPANSAKQYEKAYQKYEEILKIDPYNSTANYWVGVNYYTIKKYDIAAKYFELVLNMYPFDYDANHMLAWTYLNLGKTGEAKLLFSKALLSKPSDISSKDGLSKCK